MDGCYTCKNALFDECFGEYKCIKTELYVYTPEHMTDCSNYINGAPGISKDKPLIK